MPLTPEKERWAEALSLHMTYGRDAGQQVAERVSRPLAEEDMDGVARWLAIGMRVEQLANVGTLH